MESAWAGGILLEMSFNEIRRAQSCAKLQNQFQPKIYFHTRGKINQVLTTCYADGSQTFFSEDGEEN